MWSVKAASVMYINTVRERLVLVGLECCVCPTPTALVPSFFITCIVVLIAYSIIPQRLQHNRHLGILWSPAQTALRVLALLATRTRSILILVSLPWLLPTLGLCSLGCAGMLHVLCWHSRHPPSAIGHVWSSSPSRLGPEAHLNLP